MKSAQINQYGGSEVIEINQSTSEPTVSSGKVLVTIKAAGVNPADWKSCSTTLKYSDYAQKFLLLYSSRD